MSVTLEQLQSWMNEKEDEHLEFKEAKERFGFDNLVEYCVALANEGGGTLILGVTDKIPRQVVGTKAFDTVERTKVGLVQRLRLRIEVDEVPHPEGRILVFSVPSRPTGMPIQDDRGAYWMRSGENLVPMTPDQLKRIFNEAEGQDFSAEICPKATMEDLLPEAVQRFRELWVRKSGKAQLNHVTDHQLLSDAELLDKEQLTYGALILFGRREALGRFLPQAEVIFEYRPREASGPAEQRVEFRQGFLSFNEEIWQLVNQRNGVEHFQDGFFMADIPTFNEAVIREAILNAVCHRDYRLPESVFIRQFPRRLEVVSPGGFPPTINQENILYRQYPRNRRIAEIFGKCGLVERSGQGVNLMFEQCIREGKPKPDFSQSDESQVWALFRGEIEDPRFLQFLARIGPKPLENFTTGHFLLLDSIRKEEAVPEKLKELTYPLLEQGVIEKVGRGRGVRYILSRKFYLFIDEKGVYTRRRGLDRPTNKALLLKHIQDNREEGTPLRDLLQVLPSFSRAQVQTLLRELKSEGLVNSQGRTKGGRWHPSPRPTTEDAKDS